MQYPGGKQPRRKTGHWNAEHLKASVLIAGGVINKWVDDPEGLPTIKQIVHAGCKVGKELESHGVNKALFGTSPRAIFLLNRLSSTLAGWR